MAYIKIENGVVIQKQPNAAAGFIEFNAPVVCGQLYTAVEGEEGTVVNPAPTPPSQEELDIAAKIAGVLITGVMCSATAKDQWGLASIKDDVVSGTSFNFHFDNGNTLVLTPATWATFEIEWKSFRATFFPLPE